MTRRLPLHRKMLYATIVVFGFFGFLELGLRLLHLGQPPAIGKLQFGYETGIPIYDSDGIEREGEVFQQLPLFQRDPDLFWRPIANTPFTGPHGLRKPEPPWQADSPEVLTILVLGDSCSFLGQSTYAARLEDLLTSQTQRSVRVYNASCPGYSSLQGRLRLKELNALRPDVVIVYFGWNDHWRSLNGCTDQELLAKNQLVRQSQAVLRHFHFYWFIYSAVAPEPQLRTDPEKRNAPVRVPLADYENNLRDMAAQVAQWNGRTLFLTAPTSFQQHALPDWAAEFFGTFYQMPAHQVAQIPQTHHLYNETVRQVGTADNRVAVLDLCEHLGSNPVHFRQDCIHLSEAGHARAAQLVADALQAMR